MSARSIGEIIAPIIVNAVGLARLQDFLATIDDQAARKNLVMAWWQYRVITSEEAELLIEFNGLEAA